MKIVADTNIWYELSKDNNLYNKVKEKPISSTFVSLTELSKTYNILNNIEKTRKAIQMLFRFQKHMVLEPPFIHIIKLKENFRFNPLVELSDMLGFLENIANGKSVTADNEMKYIQAIETHYNSLEDSTKFYNKTAEEISRSVEKNKHKKINSIPYTEEFINHCVKRGTENKVDLSNFDFNKVELLIKTLDFYFKTLETSKMKIQRNDWGDLFQLAYVQPGDKYWTLDKRWINLIKQAKCENYLFQV